MANETANVEDWFKQFLQGMGQYQPPKKKENPLLGAYKAFLQAPLSIPLNEFGAITGTNAAGPTSSDKGNLAEPTDTSHTLGPGGKVVLTPEAAANAAQFPGAQGGSDSNQPVQVQQGATVQNPQSLAQSIGISPMAMQMYYQQTVAPYLQLATMMNNNAIQQYQQAIGQEKSQDYIKNNPAAMAYLAQAPAQMFGSQMLNNSLMAATAAAPAADMLQRNINQAWQQGISNVHTLDAALGNYMGSSLGASGSNFANLLNPGTTTGTATTPGQTASSSMQQALQNLQNLVGANVGQNP